MANKYCSYTVALFEAMLFSNTYSRTLYLISHVWSFCHALTGVFVDVMLPGPVVICRSCPAFVSSVLYSLTELMTLMVIKLDSSVNPCAISSHFASEQNECVQHLSNE